MICSLLFRVLSALASLVPSSTMSTSANLHFTFSLFDAFQLLTSLEKSEKLKSEKAIYV